MNSRKNSGDKPGGVRFLNRGTKSVSCYKYQEFAHHTFYASSNADYYLEQVAISHNRRHLDIPSDLYELWLKTLIQTLRDFDAPCSDEVELAWRLVMTPGIVYMTFHYERDRPVGRPSGPSQE